METISNILFWISNGLLVPVIVLLLLFFFRALLMAAIFFTEFYQRMKLQKQLAIILETVNAQNVLQILQQQLPTGKFPLLGCIEKLIQHRDETAYCQRLLANYEVNAEKELGCSRTFTKLGPILGLMGTLIPMGPALVGLAQGDISSMAYNMQMAFATTVVGMVIAAIGIVTLQIKQRWYAREMNDLEYLYRIITHSELQEN